MSFETVGKFSRDISESGQKTSDGFRPSSKYSGDRRYSLRTNFESGCSWHSYYNFITTLKLHCS